MCFGVFVQVNEGSHMAQAAPIGYIIQENGCWEWVGAASAAGYGKVFWRGRYLGAHRWMYERHKGPIPDGLYLDHLCKNPPCCNPDHLEPVTNRENLLRGDGPAGSNSRKTHCPAGHPYTTENTYIRLDKGGRMCKECGRAKKRKKTNVPT